MICNLWHIKQTNGLYYYALDYLRALGASSTVYVRPVLFDAARVALPGHRIVAAGKTDIVRILGIALLRGEQVFTPTSHPLPLHSRQLVVVHDDYPFLGQWGRLKRLLFQVGLWSSGCEVGHINHTTSLDALRGSTVEPPRLRYMPNSPPDPGAVAALRVARAQQVCPRSDRIRVALFGSDSPKKRYESLFDAVALHRLDRYRFEIYGHENEYFRSLQGRYPNLDIQLTSSSQIEASVFLASIDAVVSVAGHEGFGRLIALALAAGVPAFLLDSPVFTEFFARSTKLHADVDSLVSALDTFDPMQMSPGLFAEQEVLAQAFETAKSHLRQLATCTSI